MAVQSLKEILECCLSIERKAVSFYSRLAANSGLPELRSFWKNMSAQEADHVKYWLLLIELEDRGGLINIFDRPEATVQELEKLSAALDAVTGSGLPESPVQAMLTAFKLEFMMMHPAFPALFYIMDKMTGDLSPERSYREHIGGLIGMARRMGVSSPEFEIIADLIDRQWTVSQDLARRMAEIKIGRAHV
jgi:rubrerythrin